LELHQDLVLFDFILFYDFDGTAIVTVQVLCKYHLTKSSFTKNTFYLIKVFNAVTSFDAEEVTFGQS
jgi:hypothetical protein